MSKKITFAVSLTEDGERHTDDIIADDLTVLGDCLNNNGVMVEYDESSDTYYVVDGEFQRTGEYYQVLSVMDTTEKPRGFGE